MRLRAGVVTVLALLTLTTVGMLPAQAATATTCKVSGAVGFSPGLKTATQTIKNTYAKSAVTACSGGLVKSGKLSGVLTGKQNCAKGSAAGAMSVTWNTGATSKIAKATFVEGVAGKATIKGTVTSGPFTGGAFSVTALYKPAAGNCSTGVSKATFTGTLKA
jgi:hypothetical protein